MNHTRIAGLAFDARHAQQIRQTAQIYSYARHIRRLANDAAIHVAGPAPEPALTSIVRGTFLRDGPSLHATL